MTQAGWDFNVGSGGGDKQKIDFTKFPVGITRIRVIDDAPSVRWVHWMPKHSRSINCPGKGCPICEIRKQQKANKETYTYQMGRRFAINIINRETNRHEIMEQGLTFFEDLRDLMTDLAESNKSLKDADIKVRRRGEGKDDTSYRLDIDSESPLSEADQEILQNKIDLLEYFKPHTNEQILRVISGEAWEDVMKSNQDDTTADSSDTSGDEEVEIR